MKHPALVKQAEEATLGQRTADALAHGVGSWTFLIIQSVVIVAWIAVNSLHWALRFDPPYFVLLNLGLSMQAAITGPALLISANRQEQRDHLLAAHHYAETRALEELLRANTDLTEEVHRLAADLHAHIVGGENV